MDLWPYPPCPMTDTGSMNGDVTIMYAFSCFLRLLLLQSFTAQTDRTMAAIKNKTPPTIPAAMALSLVFLDPVDGT